jgi:hypothetical protein
MSRRESGNLCTKITGRSGKNWFQFVFPGICTVAKEAFPRKAGFRAQAPPLPARFR